jgi:hypothetical protein
MPMVIGPEMLGSRLLEARFYACEGFAVEMI